MKPAVAKKVKDIKNRVRDLKANFIIAVKATQLKPEQLKDPEQRLVPRVSGLIIREGSWITGLAEKMVLRHDVKLSEEDSSKLEEATKFFKELSEVHSDEISRNLFIYRVDAEFITHLENMVLMIGGIDAVVRLKIAAVAKLEDDDGDDEAAQEEIDAAMIS